MKIAVIAHLKFPIREPFHGGLEMHTHALVEHLSRRGHDVTLFALPDSDPRFRVVAPPLDAVEAAEGIDLFAEEPGFGMDFVNKFHAYASVMNAIQEGPFDLVHNNSLHFLPLALAHTLDCPMVTSLHCPPFASLRSGVILARPYLGNHFVAVSQSTARQWASDITHCSVVLNGIAVDRWDFSPEGKPRTAFWFGRICPEKGPEYAIKAARRAGFRLRLAGSIYDQEYFDRAVAPELDDTVEYIGHLDHAGICREAGRAAVGMFTSTWEEPFGLVLPELLACGTPVVAFDSGATREILDNSCGVIVPKYDVEALAAALPTAARLDRKDCRRRAERDFSVSRMIDGYETIYRRLAPASAPRAAAWSVPSLPTAASSVA
ncbi:glycosyltransferase [Neolewinella litorea]|uniref:Glycosyltransferase family 4 protein n=1 Tax=Neolewinella litorea TaxID=2562452 RepID=A0A4S4NMZ7_9BACT|nr:glycosyltransferase [Neolewinella litorea]THH40375.1 glycosyltransferase family 4 protein [Neolewinella litorea]